MNNTLYNIEVECFDSEDELDFIECEQNDFE
jgi:hypothetical protein